MLILSSKQVAAVGELNNGFSCVFDHDVVVATNFLGENIVEADTAKVDGHHEHARGVQCQGNDIIKHNLANLELQVGLRCGVSPDSHGLVFTASSQDMLLHARRHASDLATVEWNCQVGELADVFRLLRRVLHLHNLAVGCSVDDQLTSHDQAGYLKKGAVVLLSQEFVPLLLPVHLRGQRPHAHKRLLCIVRGIINVEASLCVRDNEAIGLLGDNVSNVDVIFGLFRYIRIVVSIGLGEQYPAPVCAENNLFVDPCVACVVDLHANLFFVVTQMSCSQGLRVAQFQVPVHILTSHQEAAGVFRVEGRLVWHLVKAVELGLQGVL